MRRSCDRRCTNCVDGWRRKRKCHEDERKREQERVREVKAKKEISVVPTETPTTSEELEALESEWNTLNATNTELQDLLKTVRQLVSDQEKQTSKLSTIDRDKDEIIYLVQSIITQNKGGLEEERLAFATKYAEAQQKPISKLPLDERERMKMDENGLLEQTIEFGTIEITLYSYLLRRYDQALPIRVQEFMAKYSKENGSAQGLVNAMTQQQPPATHSSKTKTTAETETKPDVVSTKHTITVTECSRCHGPFRASVSTQSTSSDKRFCDCCVRLLPEASFSSTEWQKRRPMRCRECTGELDVANTQALEKLERQEVFLKRIDDLHRAARASWTSTLTTFYPLEEARRLVSNDLQLKQYEADLTVSKFEVHKMLLHCRNLLANDNSIERMGRDKALYATYQNTQRSIRMLLAARLQLYSVLVTRFGYRLQYYLTQEIVQVVHEAMHELS
ncbi:hypothetical protein Poli38472_013296 [Pythium oligandrum]|uniref:Uncharacterized protein n=1 Tax=Pythium oligandrum TaxID=41045 RepID=A0A8K1C2S3_PYTOL|nr:hypothetical protein Poli38472_013296 [Pythium oligandrum]|eukprot:TMW55405.1 hypothetical protein Poli38472_013296 [Pythium oligandrum]